MIAVGAGFTYIYKKNESELFSNKKNIKKPILIIQLWTFLENKNVKGNQNENTLENIIDDKIENTKNI